MFEQGKFIDCLDELSDLAHLTNRTKQLLFLRALIREHVSDLIGSLSDLQQLDRTLDILTTKARVLMKLGYASYAKEELVNIINSNATKKPDDTKLIDETVGIIGRRFDLELLGISNVGIQLKGDSLDRFRGVIIEHLISLGEFESCDLHFKSDGTRKFSINGQLKKYDKLGDTFLQASGNFKEIESIRGWLQIDEAKVLGFLAATIPAGGCVVEIGSFYGKSTVAMALGSRIGNGIKIHSIDPHLGLAGIEPHSTLQRLELTLRSKEIRDLVTIHAGTSSDIAASWSTPNIGLLFIDALHDYESVKKDFELWSPYLLPQGIVAFHDADQPGVNQLVSEIIGGELLIPMGLREGLFVFRKRASGELPIASDERALWREYLSIVRTNYLTWLRGEERKRERLIAQQFAYLERLPEAHVT